MKDTNFIDIVNKFIQLPEPCMRILVLEVIAHSPHDMVCTSNVGLKKVRWIFLMSLNSDGDCFGNNDLVHLLSKQRYESFSIEVSLSLQSTRREPTYE